MAGTKYIWLKWQQKQVLKKPRQLQAKSQLARRRPSRKVNKRQNYRGCSFEHPHFFVQILKISPNWFFFDKVFAYSDLRYIFAVRKGGAIAQSVEQWTENPCVPGSIPGGTTPLNTRPLQISYLQGSLNLLLTGLLTDFLTCTLSGTY